jgi:multidrug efflux pump
LTLDKPEEISLSKLIQLLRMHLKAMLPQDVTVELGGIVTHYEESHHTMLWTILLAILFIYCVLAIQFESFIDPLIILGTVPLACFGALITVWGAHESLNIFSLVGLVTLIGLISKHGILLVDFANSAQERGLSATQAILDAALLRLRPILMTTCAMVLGSMPLLVSTGIGSENRRALALILISGLSFGTVLTLFVIPSMYVIIQRLKK